ncbi:ankyrin repeat domain-containing protein [Campylobacter corcagiensis]|uniref:ankyrin repeat domain-containing protein n=1 Tax=Campylobacter corcagiensis TaxID=1448857 RepID=UPI001E539BEF|nr:ankyrin repeat domain-containing protein [Campylobacter corcagiensis]QKF65211.1 ankyrin domain-containing protein [Campylobacter corcagiensis]
MKQIFTNSINSLKFINLIILTLILSSCDDNNKSHFTVTADTVIKPGSEISKYVTQDEINSFGFRYWDIDYNSKPNIVEEPLKDIELKKLLKSKNTNKILSFMKDNNISVDYRLYGGVTPLMYASFWGDKNTTKELINLGANIRAKDEQGLNPFAYALSMNSIGVVKILLNNGIKFEESKVIQYYLTNLPNYYNIEKLIIDGDNVEIIYKDIEFNHDHSKPAVYVFDYLVYSNSYEIAKLALDSGYKPYTYNHINEYDQVEVGNSINDIFTKEDIDDIMETTKQSKREMFDYNLSMDELRYDHSLYKPLEDIPNHEPMLNLLLEHNISGQPSKELMKKEYDECYQNKINFVKDDYDLYYGNFMAIERLKQYRKEESKAIPISKEEYNRFRPKTLKAYNEFCPDENSTFKSTKEVINYKNWISKIKEVSGFVYYNRDNPNKVIYLDKDKSKN